MDQNATAVNPLYAKVEAILAGKEDVNIEETLAELRQNVENAEAAQSLIKLIFVIKSVNKDADSALVATNLFSTKINYVLFNALPADLKCLVQGLWDCGTSEMTYAISDLKKRKSEFLSAIEQVEHKRDKNGSEDEVRTPIVFTTTLTLQAKIESDVQIVLPDSSTDAIHLQQSPIYAGVDRSEEDTSNSTGQQLAENAVAVLEKIKASLGLKPGAENVLEALQKMQESYHCDQQKNSQPVSEKTDADYDRIISERNELLQKNEDALKENQQLREEMATERQASKNILKKIRKERDGYAKKLKKQTEEAQSDKNHSMDKLANSATSREQVREGTNAPNETVNANFNGTIKAQTLSEDLQKRFEDVCQQLETSEKSLEVQQELNAKITKMSLENRTRHTYEISDLQDVIQQLKIKATKQNHEIQRIKELERRKTDVLVNVLEDEKQRIRDECDSVKIQLEGAQKALKEQKNEAKRRLEAEQLKWKKVVRAAQKRGTESLDTSKSETSEGKLDQDANQSECRTAVKQKLEEQIISDLRQKIESLETKLNEKSEKADAFDELVAEVDLRDQQLIMEKEKFEKLQQMVADVLEKEEAAERRAKSLDQQELKLEAMRVEYEAASKELKERVMNCDKEKFNIQGELSSLNRQLVLKTEELEKIKSEKNHFEKEAALNAKKLEESLSPRKDKAAQLESRLEVIQVAAKAQQKRLEEDLSTTRAELDEVMRKNHDLAEKISMLEGKSPSAGGVTSSSSNESEDLVSGLQKSLSELQEENNNIKSENAKERTVLVNELIATKDKLMELMKSSSTEENHITKIQTLEEKLKSAEISLTECQNRAATPVSSDQVPPPKPNSLDELFPHLDPVFRQFVELLLQNQSYMYGVFGLFIYGFLVHLYLIL
ncbi:unnamed protein product [Caenorhabditis brenneri]